MSWERPEGVFVESQAVCLLHFLGTSFEFAVLAPSLLADEQILQQFLYFLYKEYLQEKLS